MSDKPAIKIENLKKIYPGRRAEEKIRALDGIDLEVKRGEIFGFLGPNGAGKTTTIHTLMNFIFPTAGRAEIFGMPVTDPESRRRLGFLPELFNFDKFLKGKKLLEYMGSLAGMDRSTVHSRGKEILKFLDLEQGFERKVKTFSKGMTQKMGLAQALLTDPDLLILDEPTSGMDPIAKAKIKDFFLKLKEEGKTIFLSSHILSDVQKTADRVAIINKGRLIRVDTMEHLLKRPDETEIVFALQSDKATKFETTWQLENMGESTYRASVLGKEKKAKLIAELSDSGADIISLKPRSMELEEIFMQLVENGSETD